MMDESLKIILIMKGHVDSLVKPNSMNMSLTQGDSLRRKANYLERALKEETEKRQQAETKLQDYRERSMRTEKEFSRLLEKYDLGIAAMNGKQSQGQKIWNRLTDEIQNFNENSQRMLQKRCDEILNIMNRKINQMVQKTDYEIKKTQKLSEQEYKSVKEEIKEALGIAREIEEESQRSKRENKQLHFKVNVLREEKKLLLEELNQKKMLLIKVKHDYIDPLESSMELPRPRSTRHSFNNSYAKTPRFVGQPSLKVSSVSIDNPQARKNSEQGKSSDKGKDRSTMVLKTDNHFKICLQREKRKNTELKGVLGKLQAKNKEISLLIEKVPKAEVCQKALTEKETKLLSVLQGIKMHLILTTGSARETGLSQQQVRDIMKF